MRIVLFLCLNVKFIIMKYIIYFIIVKKKNLYYIFLFIFIYLF